MHAAAPNEQPRSCSRTALRILLNTATLVALAIGSPIAILVVYSLMGDIAACGAAIAVLLLAFVPAGPGRTLAGSLRRLHRDPLIRGNPRAIALVLFIALAAARSGGVVLLSRQLPVENADRFQQRRVSDRAEAYALAWSPDPPVLVVTHAHMQEPGVSLVDLAGETARATFFPSPRNHDHYPAIVPDQPLAAISAEPDCNPRGGSFYTRFLGLDEPFEELRLETARGHEYGDLLRLEFDARTNSVFAMDKSSAWGRQDRKSQLLRFRQEEFIEGAAAPTHSYALPEVIGFEQVLPHPTDPDRVFLRGEARNQNIVELNWRTGARRRLKVPPTHWDLAVDPARKRLYLTRPLASLLHVIDLERFETVRTVFVPAIPRPVEVLGNCDLVLVGSFVSHLL